MERELIVYSEARKQFRVNDIWLDMTPTESRLWEFLFRHIGQLVTYEEAIAEVWGADYLGNYSAGPRDKVLVTLRVPQRQP